MQFDSFGENEHPMKKLNIDSFIAKESDSEINHYNILSGLSHYRNELNKNKLYPSLTELLQLTAQLQSILYSRNDPRQHANKQKRVEKFKGKYLFVEIPDQETDYIYNYELVEWTLPLLKSLIEEARAIYDLIVENISIIEVGISPIFKDEGFLMIPDIQNSTLQIHKYRSIIYSTYSSPYHSLITTHIENYKLLDFSNSAELIKQDLLLKYNDKPNLATFLCDIYLDFPFAETIFPVAKRKLLNLLLE